MADFGMMICADEEEIEEEKILKSISTKISDLIKRKKLELSVEKIELFKNLQLVVIKLPYKKHELNYLSKNRLNKLNKLIQEVCHDHQIKECLLSVYMPDTINQGVCTKNKYTGHYLYRSMISNILDEIFSKRGIKTSNLDITIIHGENNLELYTIIKLLSPVVKYMTIVKGKQELDESELEQIYSDTGLSVRIACDMKSAFKNADVVINLNAIKESKTNYKIKPRTIIVNCNSNPINWTFTENILINSVDIRLPQSLTEKLEENLMRSFKPLEIAEMILSHRIEKEGKILADDPEYESMNNLSREFGRCGYKIEGFIGRNGVLKSSELKLYGT